MAFISLFKFVFIILWLVASDVGLFHIPNNRFAVIDTTPHMCWGVSQILRNKVVLLEVRAL